MGASLKIMATARVGQSNNAWLTDAFSLLRSACGATKPVVLIVFLLVIADPLVNDGRDKIVAFAATNRLPAIYPYRTFVDVGGLMSYGVDLPDLSRRAATYVDRILTGAKAAELPIEQPTKFELVVNLKTAQDRKGARADDRAVFAAAG